MFHEIWIGGYRGASLRERCVGWLQRRGVLQVLNVLKPDCVHCTNALYKNMLEHVGCPARLLPLFGGVPVVDSPSDPFPPFLALSYPQLQRDDLIVAALFGTIHPTANLQNALIWLDRYSRSQSKHLLVVSLGHSPSASSTFECIEACFPPGLSPSFVAKGAMDSSDLSGWLQHSDIALSTTPFNIIEKSSSAVTFAEHGVPVLVVDEGAPVRSVPYLQRDLAPDFWLFGDDRLSSPAGLPHHRPPRSRLPQVAAQFLSDLDV
jgi:hypothetical protein